MVAESDAEWTEVDELMESNGRWMELDLVKERG